MTNSEQGEGELPWSERINQLSIHPEAASMRDIAKMAGELSEANWTLSALQAKVADLEKIIAAAKEVHKQMVNFRTEDKPDWPRTAWWGKKGYEKGDEQRNFFTQAYLYNLIGKEDARTLLAYMQQLSEVLRPDQGETGI